MHAEKCPICGGAGQLQGINDLSGSAANPPTRTCHGCGGKGWVEVRDDKPEWVITTPWTQPPEPNDIPPYSVGDFPGWEPRYITGGVS